MYEEHKVERTHRFLSFGKKLRCTFFPEGMGRIAFAKSSDFFDLICGVRDYLDVRRIVSYSFALISAIWDKFFKNCIVCYKPGENIAVDEQLFPTKATANLCNIWPTNRTNSVSNFAQLLK